LKQSEAETTDKAGGEQARPSGETRTPGRASGSSARLPEAIPGLRTEVRRTFIEVVEDKPKLRRVQSAPPPIDRRDQDEDDDDRDADDQRSRKRKKKDKKKHRRRDDSDDDDMDGEEIIEELTDIEEITDDEPMDQAVFERHRSALLDLKPKDEDPTGVDLYPWIRKKIVISQEDKGRMHDVVEAHKQREAGIGLLSLGGGAPLPSASSSSAHDDDAKARAEFAEMCRKRLGIKKDESIFAQRTREHYRQEASSASGSVPASSGRAPGGPPSIGDLVGKKMPVQIQILGDYLYHQILKQTPRAPKIVGMLLDACDRNELLDLCESPGARDKKLKEALAVLRSHDDMESRRQELLREAKEREPKQEEADPEQALRPVGPQPPPQEIAISRPHRDHPRPEPFDSTKGYPGEGPGTLVSGGRKKASRLINQPVRDVKRGQLAWQCVELEADKFGEAAQRLLVHTVSDDVGLKQYLPAVRKFLEFAEQEKLNCVTWQQIDSALLRYLGKQCYVDHKHPHQGVLAVNGVCYLYPEAVRELPHAWRATKGWSRFAIVQEGQPVPTQALACMSAYLGGLGDPKAAIAADCIAIAADGYLREQDLFQLRIQDVVMTNDTAALLLGQSQRGEGCKSGRDQGVVMDEPHSVDVLRRLTAGRDNDQKVFELTADEYRRFWKKAAKEVLGDSKAAGTPHSARHTGASRDLTEGYRTLEQVMKRGRWKALNSVHRYAKPHAWYAALAALPSEVRDKGDLILEARAPRRVNAV